MQFKIIIIAKIFNEFCQISLEEVYLTFLVDYELADFTSVSQNLIFSFYTLPKKIIKNGILLLI